MRKIQFDSKYVGNTYPTYIITEIGGNFSDFEGGIKFIKSALSCGANAVKIQTFKAEQLVSKYATFNMPVTHGKKNQLDIIDLNLELIEFFNKKIHINTKTYRSSDFEINSFGTQRLVDICKHLGATTYLSGILGKEYLDENLFHQEGIKIIFENFIHPTYNQLGNNFVSNMSIIDLLFNEGENSSKIISDSLNY